ncbi:hypothetical protein ACFX13_006901 [Malus domestica]
MVPTSILKEIVNTLSSMPMVNKVEGIDTVPAFVLPNKNCCGWVFCISIVLEVRKSLGKHKKITCLTRLRKEVVFGVNETNDQGYHQRGKVALGGGLVVLFRNRRTAYETLCSLRAGNSAKDAS